MSRASTRVSPPRGPSPARGAGRFTDEDYRNILTFRTRLRQFLSWSAEQARAAGLTPAQHQLILAVRGHPDPEGPTIGEIAEYLQLRHHSAVGLVDRAAAAGLVRRREDSRDRRVSRVQLERAGADALDHLTALHVAELRALTIDDVLPHLRAAVAEDAAAGAEAGAAGAAGPAAGPAEGDAAGPVPRPRAHRDAKHRDTKHRDTTRTRRNHAGRHHDASD